MSHLELTWESWSEFGPEGYRLMQEESEEYEAILGLEPLDINHEEMEQASAAGRLNVLCARDRGLPVGYFMIFISMDQEVKTQVIASQGPWYVKAEAKYYGLGLRLLDEAKTFVSGLGIKLFELHHPVVGRGARLEALFLRLGARPINRTYRLKL